MSMVHDQIYEANSTQKKELSNAAVAHMEELESNRIAAEKAAQLTVKGAWERLREKRTPKVLHKIPVHLQ